MEFRTIVNRTIHAVGQGAFYTEEVFSGFIGGGFEHCRVVYDCGRGTNSPDKNNCVLDREVEGAFQEGEKIDAVFISHFHADHINGLKTLLTHYKVERVYLPILAPMAKTLLLLDCEQESIRDYILNPTKSIHRISPKTKVIGVREMGSHEEPSEPVTIEDTSEPVVIEGTAYDAAIPSGTQITPAKKYTVWGYIPYNLYQEENLVKLQKEFGSTDLPEPHSLNQWGNLVEMKRIYQKLFHGKEVNANSLAVYSGRIHSDFWNNLKAEKIMLGIRHILSDQCCGCLYLGDYKLDANGLEELEKSYQDYLDVIRIIQLPHHGSKDNFNKAIFEVFPQCRFFFCSAGSDNTYGHPDDGVLLQCIRNGKTVHWISEKKESELVLDFRLEERIIPEKKEESNHP
ncbi:MAG: MBL fold metallo-hydrolase [Oscillospiraceae bacterium]|nr:MBL fold metallo-hydrolase [Oscillospiraceae bacterium]